MKLKIVISILILICLTNAYYNSIILDRFDTLTKLFENQRTITAAVLAENLELRVQRSKRDIKTIGAELERLDVMYADKITTFKKINDIK